MTASWWERVIRAAMQIELRDLQPTPVDHELLRQVAERTVAKVAGALDHLSVALVSDERIAQVNEQFRNRPGPTDVIAFEAEADAEGVAGEVIISVDTAARQAAEAGHDLHRELCLLVAHGVLHVLGYDDEQPAGAAEMTRLQDQILSELEVLASSDEQLG